MHVHSKQAGKINLIPGIPGTYLEKYNPRLLPMTQSSARVESNSTQNTGNA